ncbi:tachylectin-related carbohydrate-binding protein [Spirosoma fluviale]|uniref:Tachylectin n=1 Tax=Spirosoma fluviale TaxID=1597977 RepID=A0A286G9J4_9BACT|nr:tachylectin-related carbohydrate-binding protein [Spirosoma fluviale]SOD92178.1 Tachylectin [Spirosoma fluviale]
METTSLAGILVDLQVPLPVSSDVSPEAPQHFSLLDSVSDSLEPQTLVEPLDTFLPRLERITKLSGPRVTLKSSLAALSRQVSHRQWQTTLNVSQASRGTCWAFAGIAALEAAYARIGVHVDLSEHYLFHLSKAHENHVGGPGIHSLVGFQGSADIVHHLAYWAVPLSAHVPYSDQGPLQNLANSIPNTGMALSGSGGGTREQADWFEFDLRNIPLMGRWFAQYRVKTFGKKDNFTNDDIRQTLSDGYDVVVNVYDKINAGGHVLLIHGYDDDTKTFAIKNSQSLPGFSTMLYVNDPQFTIQYGSMYFITAVQPVQTQWAAMWVGRWETDHDGWRGRLIIRRFINIRGNGQLPNPGSRISLGTWYAEDGRVLDVVGHFVDDGRGLHCDIGGQPFELYLHTRDPYRAGGRTWWNKLPFGVVLSRGTAVGAGSGFDRSESIGIWDTVHDGWRGQLRIGVDPSYVQAADAVTRRTWIDPGTTAHRIDTHVDFGGDNRNQYFQLLLHTREDGLMGGVTSWGGKDWPVEGRLSQNLYTITPEGTLNWYRNTGRARLAREWEGPKAVGSGWGGFKTVFGGGDGVLYAIAPDGKLMWYFHDGRNQGQFQWQGGKEVGTGWASFARVFAGDGGVIYAVATDGRLLWYRHLGRRDGSARWQGPFQVGTGWNGFIALVAGPDGCLYGTQPDGSLLWYRHYGYDQGYPIWHGPVRVGSGWQGYDKIWAVGNGYIYGRTAANGGDLWLWRHHGFLTGEASWTNGVKVGNGWGGGMREVIAT